MQAGGMGVASPQGLSWAFGIGAGAMVTADGGSPAKKSKGGGNGGGEEGDKGIMKETVKLVLKIARGQATLEGFLYKTMDTLTENPIVPAGNAAGKNYQAKTKGVKGHNVGPPNVHIVIEVLKVMQAHPSCDAAKITNFLSRCDSPATVQAVIPVFWMNKCHDESRTKIVWKCEYVPIDPSDLSKGSFNVLDEEMPKICKEFGGKELPGTAPRNPGERKLRGWLDKRMKGGE